MENRVKVEIFGQTYTINGDASPEYMLQLSEYVNNQMERVSENISNSNPAQVAILVALNIADEYFQLKQLKAGAEFKLEEKTKTLISMLDEGLIGDIFSHISAIRR